MKGISRSDAFLSSIHKMKKNTVIGAKKKPPRRASDAGGDDNKRVERIQLDYSYGSAILAKPYDPCGSSMTRFFARLAHPCANRDLSVRYNIRVVAIEKWFRRSITLFHSTVHS